MLVKTSKAALTAGVDACAEAPSAYEASSCRARGGTSITPPAFSQEKPQCTNDQSLANSIAPGRRQQAQGDGKESAKNARAPNPTVSKPPQESEKNQEGKDAT